MASNFAQEYEFYYLQSRYYDPEFGRFLNPEPNVDCGEFDDGAGLLGFNVFAYCANNPVNMIDVDGHAAINVFFALVFGVVGWKIGDYFAKALGFYSGAGYWAIRIACTAGGAILGWYGGKLVSTILARYLKRNPSVALKLASKYGGKTFFNIMKGLGVNPFTLAQNGSKFIAIARLFNNKAITIPYKWAVTLYKMAKDFGYKIELHEGHGGYKQHIHLFSGNKKIGNLHIQITKAAWDYLKKLIK